MAELRAEARKHAAEAANAEEERARAHLAEQEAMRVAHGSELNPALQRQQIELAQLKATHADALHEHRTSLASLQSAEPTRSSSCGSRPSTPRQPTSTGRRFRLLSTRRRQRL